MKNYAFTLLLILATATFVACSDDKTATTPSPSGPGGQAFPTPTPYDDGYITWQSEGWTQTITNRGNFAAMLTGSGCYTDGYYPAWGFQYFFGNQDCEYYTDYVATIVKYNPTTNKIRLYVYGAHSGSAYVMYSRETTPSDQGNGLVADFGPLATNGTIPDDLANHKVWLQTPVTSYEVENLPVTVSFAPQSSAGGVLTQTLKRVN